LPASIHATNDLKVVFDKCDVIFEAIPVSHIRRVLMCAMSYIRKDHRFVILSKGIEQGTLLLPSQIISDVLSVSVVAAIAAGPSFAAELAHKQITALDVASTDPDFTDEVRTILKSNYCCPVCSPDPVGIQCGSALKNVLALGIGILDGAQRGENTKAFVFTRGLEELATISHALGGLPQTLYGVSGIGDLVLTALGNASRNNLLGQGLGKGQALEDIIKQLGTVPESLNTCIALHQFCTLYDIKAPVLEGIYQMVYEKLSVSDFLQNLITYCLQENRHRSI
jgi:glycerol-3-phosphate dehydrogenase (NAD(P)+)